MRALLICAAFIAASVVAQAASKDAEVRSVTLPGATGPVSMDLIAFDRPAGRLWIPAGDTGSVDVYDAKTGVTTRIEGFATAEREVRGRKRKMGPSAAAVGPDLAYTVNRASSEVCAIDKKALTKGKCVTLPSSPDCITYVAPSKEVWVTTPHQHALMIFDAALARPPATLTVDGLPEGYAVDEPHGVFYTNLEDKDRTLRIDIASRKVLSTWKLDCGSEGPRGVAVDSQRNLVFVACTDHVVVLDAAHDGAILARADTGAGVDNIDYLPEKKQLFVASGKAARLNIFTVGDHGALTGTTVTTAQGARTVVADSNGNAYLINPAGGGFLIYSAK